MNNKIRILLVEDDENLGFILQDFLEMEGYTVVLKKNGSDGLEIVRKEEFDLVILDVMMPVRDGFSVATDLKKLRPQSPFIFLTARNMEEDRLKGLRIGADDYITKPFSTEELKLRIEIILRRTGKSDKPQRQEVYEIGTVIFDFKNQLLQIHGAERRLTKKEAMVLRLLCQNKNQLVRREEALVSIWGSDDYFMGRSMDVYIAKLRSYLKDDPTVTIVNVHGTGFQLVVNS